MIALEEQVLDRLNFTVEQGSIAAGGTPEQLEAIIRRDYALWVKVVKAGGVKPE